MNGRRFVMTPSHDDSPVTDGMKSKGETRS